MITADKNIKCYHCGENCADDSYTLDDKVFCCAGCRTVYELLNKNELSKYYTMMDTPGISLKDISDKKYEYLDDSEVIRELNDYIGEKISVITFRIPQMHCSSCIWLLENLHKLDGGVVSSTVNFLRKELEVRYNPSKISLKKLVQTLAAVGYEPEINLSSTQKQHTSSNKSLYYKVGIAGFCFGNIMLLSFPEYLSLNFSDHFFKQFFGWLNLILALPVFFYSASEYFVSAFKGLRKKIVNIDVPIALGILILFSRSLIEIASSTGAGYFDSMTGLVFLLLLGKLFQQKTYDSLNFERSYKSYFPLAVTVKSGDEEKSVPVSQLKVGNRIIVKKNEIIPADSILFSGEGIVDFSFVTGESTPVNKVMGELVYAGGRQLGGAVELEVVKEVSQSYLTRLWNNAEISKKSESSFSRYANAVSKYFTAVILFIALVSAALWIPHGMGKALNVLTAVLIVACPCALALSIPFTLGNTMRIFGRNKFYLKNTAVIESMAGIDSIVFDKTGTITETAGNSVKFEGTQLNGFQKELVKSAVRSSTHPLSKNISSGLGDIKFYGTEKFEEFSGRGISALVMGHELMLGLPEFVKGNNLSDGDRHPAKNDFDSRVYLSIDEEILGYFRISNLYRSGADNLIKNLSSNYKLALLSGDNESEKENLSVIFGGAGSLRFRQSPADKLDYIKIHQNAGAKIMMVGDGLNDAGALGISSVGVAVSDNVSYFTPACDAILDSSSLTKLKSFIDFSKTSRNIIYASFGISFLYNIAGLSFAVDGMLSPLVAAVLMPLSSISVVAFASFATGFMARRKGL